MAYDSYSRTNDPPPVYDHVESRLKNPQSYYANDGYKTNSRSSSRDRGEPRPPPEQPSSQQPRRPITEAVNTAFHDAHVPGISQEMMAQITQSVVEQLKKSGALGAGAASTQNHQQPMPPTPQYPPPSQQQFHPPPSPSNHSSGSPPPRNLTPPSPQKHTEQHPDSPGLRAEAYDASAGSQRGSEEKRPSSGLSNNSDGKESRPKPIHRPRSSLEETTLEKIWGPLFDEEGKPTKRLAQFLRGLAVHLVYLSLQKEVLFLILSRLKITSRNIV